MPSLLPPLWTRARVLETNRSPLQLFEYIRLKRIMLFLTFRDRGRILGNAQSAYRNVQDIISEFKTNLQSSNCYIFIF